MNCPCCSEPLTALRADDAVVHGCASCRGLWLDNALCRALVGNSLPDAVRDLIHTVSPVAPPDTSATASGYREPARVDPSTSTERLCPVCRAELDAYVTNPERYGIRVRLDVCAAHGSWFDRGEAWALLQAISLKRMSLDLDLEVMRLNRSWDMSTDAMASFGPMPGTIRFGTGFR